MDFKVYKNMKAILNRLLDGLFPGLCLCCGLASGRNIDLCEGCESDFPRLHSQCPRCAEPLPSAAICPRCLAQPPAFDAVVAPYLYQPPLTQVITGFKHGGDLSAGRVLGTLLAKHIEQTMAEAPSCVTAMPLHWRRHIGRGFNQAQEIARTLSRQTGIPLHDRLVRRVRHTPSQQGAARQQRTRNLRGAFAASPRCASLSIAVIDDVVTTTSTARAVAQALKRAGAARVEIWCLARTTLEK